MEKEDLLKKQELAEEIGMKFDEVAELFSEETLCTMQMVKFRGRKGIDAKVACDAKGSCSNGVCPESNWIICDINFYCPEKDTTAPPIEFNLVECTNPPFVPPTPPTVQQDAICWQTPPLPPIITK